MDILDMHSIFFAFPHFSPGAPKFLDLTFKYPLIFDHLAKFCQYQSRELGDFEPEYKKKQLLPKNLEEDPTF